MAKAKKIAKRKIVKATTDDATAKVAEPLKSSARGTRYTSKQKANILLFVDKHNAKNGRGGAATAARKFGITQLTISKWMKETGAPAPKRKTSADFEKTIKRLADIYKDMATMQDKLDSLRKEYVELKAVL